MKYCGGDYYIFFFFDFISDNVMKNMNMIFCKNLLENDVLIY